METTTEEVLFALKSRQKSLRNFKALISPAAAPFLEEMATISHQATQKRFGKTIQMYAPLYLSNVCQNICPYCAFSADNPIPRKTLTETEIREEAMSLKNAGFDHVLLVTGEAQHEVGTKYIGKAISLVRTIFSQVSIEVQPLETEEYKELIKNGLTSVLVYQETYHRNRYKIHHPKGKKSNYAFRLATPERLGAAGIHKIGLGALLGLEDWRTDSYFTAMHLFYLEKKYWKSKFSISFPRLRPIERDTRKANTNQAMNVISDRELVQLICAYRICNDFVELSISTRESETFRDYIFQLGITSMSAGSKTNPGGYVGGEKSLEQFEIADHRSAAKISEVVRRKGYEVVWKDWENQWQIV